MSTKSSPLTENRDALFDNIRCLMIFLVVLGHMFSPVSGQNDAAQLIYKTAFLTHMPVFVLLSGYFSKNVEKSRDTAVAKFLLPYLVLNLMSWGIYILQGGKAWYKLDVFYPRWGLWFLLAMFVWKIFLKDLVRIRYILPISFGIGLLAGLFDKLDSDMAMGRIFAFLPFFLLGYFLKKEHIEKLRRLPKWIPSLGLLISLGFVVFTHFNYKHKWVEFLCFKHQMYFMRDSYHTCKLSMSDGMIVRAFLYLTALIMIFSLIAIFPRKRCYFSYIGQNTLPIYAIHLFLLPYIKDLELFGGSGWGYNLFSILISAALVLLLSSRPVVLAYQAVFNFLEQLIFPKNKTNA